MSILVVGSVAFDSIRTPYGSADRCLGGAATYFSLAASYFTQVRVTAVVGEDFTAEHEAVFAARGIDITGIEHAQGRSFHWTGAYHDNLNEAQTLRTDLNVFENFSPRVPASYADSEHLFLANIDPVLQHRVRKMAPRARVVCGDTMNYWITGHADALAEVLRELDILLVNDGEAKLLSGENTLALAAERILQMGPKTLVIKHGEHGATAFFSGSSFADTPKARFFRAPALPLTTVMDPTGAGDSFGGGFFGYLASQKTLSPSVFKRAMFYGGVMGSFAVERFGTERLQQLTRAEIDERFGLFRELSHLDAD